jgi:hypothetical protein
VTSSSHHLSDVGLDKLATLVVLAKDSGEGVSGGGVPSSSGDVRSARDDPLTGNGSSDGNAGLEDAEDPAETTIAPLPLPPPKKTSGENDAAMEE